MRNGRSGTTDWENEISGRNDIESDGTMKRGGGEREGAAWGPQKFPNAVGLATRPTLLSRTFDRISFPAHIS
jgi:hypothetical protein